MVDRARVGIPKVTTRWRVSMAGVDAPPARTIYAIQGRLGGRCHSDRDAALDVDRPAHARPAQPEADADRDCVLARRIDAHRDREARRVGLRIDGIRAAEPAPLDREAGLGRQIDDQRRVARDRQAAIDGDRDRQRAGRSRRDLQLVRHAHLEAGVGPRRRGERDERRRDRSSPHPSAKDGSRRALAGDLSPSVKGSASRARPAASARPSSGSRGPRSPRS